MQPHRGGIILTFGILSLVICAPLGIVAWVLGGSDLGKMTRGEMDPEGRGLTKAGYICGIIGTAIFALQVLATLAWVVLFVVIGVAGAAGAGP